MAERIADAGARTFWIASALALTGYAPPAILTSGAGRAPFVRARTRDAAISSLTFSEYVRP